MKISIERIRRLLFQATSKLEWLESGEKSCVFTKLRDSFRFRCLTARGKANQMNRKAYFHYTLDPDVGDILLVDNFYDMGIKLAELIGHFYGNYQVVMAIHFNESQYHIHFISNNIDYITGNRLDLDRKKLSELKEAGVISDEEFQAKKIKLMDLI